MLASVENVALIGFFIGDEEKMFYTIDTNCQRFQIFLSPLPTKVSNKLECFLVKHFSLFQHLQERSIIYPKRLRMLEKC